MLTTLLFSVLLATAPVTQASFAEQFTLTEPSEVVATISANCRDCDWSVRGREAPVLQIYVDGAYSQHLVLVRGTQHAPYRVMLGNLPAGAHEIALGIDQRRSSRTAEPFGIGPIEIKAYGANAPEYPWLSRAPFLRARPGSLEKFSDVPLLMYAERDVPGEAGGRYQFQYTVIFTNEDGGTPADRLMATWGRTTDIEFVYGLTSEATPRGMIQAEGHNWIAFNGPRVGEHPVLWVATQNNMVADHGPDDAIRFAPAPELVDLTGNSREIVMDMQPWTYAVTSAEAEREGRIDPAASAGSGKIPDPRRYAVVEACAEVTDATFAFDIGVRGADGQVTWHATDRGEPAFRLARGGCVRGGAPLPAGVTARDIVGLCVRAYARPPRAGEAPQAASRGRMVLRRVNRVFMLDATFTPQFAELVWFGSLDIPVDGEPVTVPAPAR